MDEAWIMFSLDGYVSDDVFPDGFPFMSVQLCTVSDDDGTHSYGEFGSTNLQ